MKTCASLFLLCLGLAQLATAADNSRGMLLRHQMGDNKCCPETQKVEPGKPLHCNPDRKTCGVEKKTKTHAGFLGMMAAGIGYGLHHAWEGTKTAADTAGTAVVGGTLAVGAVAGAGALAIGFGAMAASEKVCSMYVTALL